MSAEGGARRAGAGSELEVELSVEELSAALISPEELDEPDEGPQAAVAAVFRAGTVGTELLFIQRATRDGDPWSGQMAFPGGRAEAGDRDLLATAERETAEELGLDLSPAQKLGSLANLDGGRATNRLVSVSGHCFWLPGDPPPLRPNEEVADALWVPVGTLLDRRRYIDYRYPPAGSTFPGIQLDIEAQVVWGLTLRFLADLFARLDRPFIID